MITHARSNQPSQPSTQLYSLRRHRRYSDDSSSSTSDGDDVEAICTERHFLLSFLILLVLSAIILTIYVLRRGHSSSSMANSATLSSFETDCLEAHNTFRATHNATALTWNTTLADATERWAKECQWKHSAGSLLSGSYGENLYGSSSDVYTATDPAPLNATAGVWAGNDEEAMYDYSKPTGFSEATGHFTQVVWKATTDVGCFFQTCLGLFTAGQYGVYLVCEYYPAGNVVTDDLDLFKENVQPPT
ncbi:hypothetical protein JCM1840_000493 [Sporobolomyces johnsonii]